MASHGSQQDKRGIRRTQVSINMRRTNQSGDQTFEPETEGSSTGRRMTAPG